jgi:hypothetical protein
MYSNCDRRQTHAEANPITLVAQSPKGAPPHDGLRRQGLRPIEIWVPDVRSLDFAAEAHRQSLAIAQSEQERRDQDFVDAISDFGEDGSVA